jgi:hypothetical protein
MARHLKKRPRIANIKRIAASDICGIRRIWGCFFIFGKIRVESHSGGLMKKHSVDKWMATAVLALALGCPLINQACTTGRTKFQVLNPRGEISLPPVSAPSGRVEDLAGKTIGLYWNGKAGGNHFWTAVERLLRVKLPATNIMRYEGAFDLGDAMAAKISRETDAFLYGVGD